jgi:hypothetical protein
MVTEAMFKILLPLACAWAEKQETDILKQGVALTKAQLDWARRIGIVEPERVRLRVVEEIPLPLEPVLRAAAEQTGLISPLTAGLTLRYGIFIRTDFWGDRRLLVHELAHVAQYERFDGFQPFLEAYLRECIDPPGYPFGPLEQEAKKVEQIFAGQI